MHALIDTAYPGLMGEIRRIIEASEVAYTSMADADSFLWEHSVFVASMAMTLSREEGVDALLPALAALFHDCGKFLDGGYHDDETPEERHGAEIAHKTLRSAGCSPLNCARVETALLGLYNDQNEKSIISKIVHDADFLVKFGYMGFANFFEKSVLRGVAMRRGIRKNLSKELTYAACLEKNMFTRSGKAMAATKGQLTRTLFENYLMELRVASIADYEIRELDYRLNDASRKRIPLVVVVPRCCPQCGETMHLIFDQDRGIKCEKLIIYVECTGCTNGENEEISFCLPELISETEWEFMGRPCDCC